MEIILKMYELTSHDIDILWRESMDVDQAQVRAKTIAKSIKGMPRAAKKESMDRYFDNDNAAEDMINAQNAAQEDLQKEMGIKQIETLCKDIKFFIKPAIINAKLDLRRQKWMNEMTRAFIKEQNEHNARFAEKICKSK